MEVRVLGPLRVEESEREVTLGGARDRAVLAAVALTPGETVSTHRLADALWGEHPPRSAAKQLQNLVLRIRKTLGNDSIRTDPGGYALGSHVRVDAVQFESKLAAARAAAGNGAVHESATLFSDALAIWRGDSFEDLHEWAPAAAEIARLDELRHVAQEEEIDARLACGAETDCVADVEALAVAEPLRERRWVQLMVALYRSGRQADALRAFQRAREILTEELGIEPGPELQAMERRVIAQDPELFFTRPRESEEVTLTSGAAPIAADCPYQGLLAFGVEDHERFFGRDRLVASLLTRLGDTGCVAIVGASGSGKSSLVRAGLVASLQSARVALMTPGAHPIAELERTSRQGVADPLVLVIDQFEEVFTLCDDEDERAAFLDVLVAAGRSADVAVVVAIRGDFYGHCSEHPDFAAMISAATVLLGPMSRDELRDVIERPARDVELRLEEGLTDLVLEDVASEPGVLPLISHALRETWRRRDGAVLTISGYRAAGGIRGAIARTADAIYDSLPTAQQALVRSVFLRLTDPGDGTEDTRRKATFAELHADADAGRRHVLELLVEARLVTIDEDGVEVAHEALIRGWPRLRTWLDEDRDDLRLLRDLRRAAAEWSMLDRDEGALYRGARLAAVMEWQSNGSPTDLTAHERDFLDASNAREDAERAAIQAGLDEQTQANRRLRRLLAGIGAALVIALLAGVLAVVQRDRADDEASRAQTATRHATVGRLVADSAALRGRELPLSSLLAVTSSRLADNATTRGALQQSLLADPRLRATLTGSARRYSQVAYTPDGDRVVVHGTAGVDVFDTGPAGRMERTVPLPGVARRATGLAISPDGRMLAAGSDDAAYLVDLRSSRDARVRLPTLAPVLGVAFSPNGETVVTAAGTFGDAAPVLTEESVRLWDTATGEPQAVSVDGHVASVNAVAFSPDGSMFATGGNDDRVVLHDPRTGATITTPIDVGSDVYSLAFSPDGRRLAVGALAGTFVFDPQTTVDPGTPLAAGALAAVAFSADGSQLATTNESANTIIWDVATSTVVGAPMVGGGAGVAYRPDGGELAVAGSGSTVTVWDPEAAPLVTRSVPDPSRFGGEYSPDGTVLAVPDTDSVSLHDADTLDLRGAPLTVSGGPPLAIGTTPAIVEFSPDGKQVAVAGLGATVQLFDVETGRLAGAPVALASPALALAFSPDGRLLAVGGYGGELSLVERPEGQVRQLEALGYSVLSLTFSPDGRRLVAATSGIEAVVYDQLTSRPPRITRVPGDGFVAARFSPDGTLLATGGADGSVQLRDARTFERVGPSIPSNRSLVIGIAFSNDGRMLAVADVLANVRLVDVRSRQPIGDVLAGAAVSAPSFRPDGQVLALSDSHGSALLTLDVARWRADACRLAGRNLTAAELRQYLGIAGGHHVSCSGLPRPE